jgi:hypothetical protein
MLRKDDPVYYKVKLAELMQQAIDNGIEVIVDKALEKQVTISFKYGTECASVQLISKEGVI